MWSIRYSPSAVNEPQDDYTIESGQLLEKRTAKGISEAVKKHELRHEDYLQVLENETVKMAVMNRFQSIGHTIYTVEQKKVTLTALDDKRFILDDGIHSLAYGHYRSPIIAAREMNEMNE